MRSPFYTQLFAVIFSYSILQPNFLCNSHPSYLFNLLLFVLILHDCILRLFTIDVSTRVSAFNKKRALFTSTLDLELRKKLVKCCIWSIAIYGAETWMLRAVDEKHVVGFEMLCWRRIEKISWTDHVRNEEVLRT